MLDIHDEIVLTIKVVVEGVLIIEDKHKYGRCDDLIKLLSVIIIKQVAQTMLLTFLIKRGGIRESALIIDK